MMGQLPPEQNTLFYDFNLEQHIPSGHPLRLIDQFLDFTLIRQQLTPYYSDIGRPSIDPELMIRMLLVGYCYGIHSERRLCEEVNFNLAYRWFCRLGLEGKVPNHSTFSHNRHGRFREAGLFRQVFDAVVCRCIDEGLVGGEGFAIDASFIRADVSRQRFTHTSPDWGPTEEQSRAVREYLEKLDEEPGLNRPQKSISLTDPMCQWTGAKGPADFFYSTNYLIDVQSNIIMDVEATPSTNALEVSATKTMIERVEEQHDIVPERLMGDTLYGAAANLGYLVEEKGIAPHIPVNDKSKRSDGTLSVCDFDWSASEDHYRCPEGKILKRRQRNFRRLTSDVTKAGTIIYRSRAEECRGCPRKPQCCPNTLHRKIARSIHEEARALAREITASPEYQGLSRSQRKKVEMLFAHMKRHLRFQRLRLRGLSGANDEFLLVACVQNLKRLAALRQIPPAA